MKKLLSIVLIAAMILSCFAACGGKTTTEPAAEPGTTTETPASTSTSTTTETPAATTETPAADAKIFYGVFGADHTTLNFMNNVDTNCEEVAIWCSGFLYRSVPNEEGTNYYYIPDLAAELPEKTGDHTFNVKLREEACWHNGEKITADDWMFTFQTILDPTLANSMSRFLSDGAVHITNALSYCEHPEEGKTWEDVGIKKVDDYTIEFTIDEDVNDDSIKGFCGMTYCRSNAPVYKPLWDECLSSDGLTTSYGTSTDKWMGCGPYFLDTWELNSIQVYKKNPDHWLSDWFHYDEVQYRIVPEMNARVELWEQGQLTTLSPDANTLELYIDDPRLISYGSLSVDHLDINCSNASNPVSGSDNYRKAIYHAMNREVIADKFFGHMEPAGVYVNTQAGLLSATGETYRDSKYGQAVTDMVKGWSAEGSTTGYNPELANEYLSKAYAEAGLPDDYVLTVKIAYDTEDSTAFNRTFEYLEQEIPVIFNGRMQIELVPFSIGTSDFKEQNPDGWDLCPNEWSRSLSRTYPFQCFLYYTTDYADGPNNYHPADFDEQFNHCLEIANDDYETVLAETQKLEEIYLEHVVQCPLVQEVNYTMFDDRLVLPVKTYVPGFGWGTYYADYE